MFREVAMPARSIPFAEFISTAPHEKGCVLWLGMLDKHGRARYGHDNDCASRVMWRLLNGIIPEGLHVLHTCDNPRCVNPDHLFLGTQKDNMVDCKSKGRNSRGVKVWTCKLTEAQVIEIRSAVASGKSRISQAWKYGVSYNQICVIVNRKQWKHI